MGVFIDVEATVNLIAQIEQAIPGIVTSYGYGLDTYNPSRIVTPSVVHSIMGPTTFLSDDSRGAKRHNFTIESLLLTNLNTIRGGAAEQMLGLELWGDVYAAFTLDNQYDTLLDVSGAVDYDLMFGNNSHGVRRWPPEPVVEYVAYWSFVYRHVFTLATT